MPEAEAAMEVEAAMAGGARVSVETFLRREWPPGTPYAGNAEGAMEAEAAMTSGVVDRRVRKAQRRVG